MEVGADGTGMENLDDGINMSSLLVVVEVVVVAVVFSRKSAFNERT